MINKPHIAGISLTQNKVYDGTVLSEINQFFSEVDSQLDIIERQLELAQMYSDAQNTAFPFMRLWGVQYSDGKLVIDETYFNEATQNIDYNLTLSSGQYSITNLATIPLMIQVDIDENTGDFIYTDSNSQTHTLSIDTTQDLLPSQYIFIEQNATLTLPLGITQNAFTVYLQNVLPFFQFAYTDWHKDTINTTVPLIFKYFVTTSDGATITRTESSTLPAKVYTFEDKTIDLFTAPNTTDKTVDWQNSLILQSTADETTSYGKYLYMVQDGIFTKKTYIYDTNTGEISDVSDQAGESYNVVRPYKHITEYGNKVTTKLRLEHASFDDPTITFISSSSSTYFSLEPKTRITDSDITGLGISGQFIIIYVLNNTVYQDYYENIQAMNSFVDLPEKPDYMWVVDATSYSGISLPANGRQTINVTYPSIQVIALNNGNTPITLTGNNIEEAMLVGGAKQDFVKVIVSDPTQKQQIVLENHNDTDGSVCLFIIEYKTVITPVVATNYGYKYSIELVDPDDNVLPTNKEWLFTENNINKIFGITQQKLSVVDQSSHIRVDHQIQIIQEPTDVDASGNFKFVFAKRIHKLIECVLQAKIGELYYTPIEIGKVI